MILTRVLKLEQAEPYSVLGVGLVTTAAVGGTIARFNIIRRWMGRS